MTTRRKKIPSNSPANRCWSLSIGRRGLNRIRVYERYPGGPLWVEWYVGPKRIQESLTDTAGVAIHDKQLAIDIATAMSEAQRKKREAMVGRELLGLAQRRTLKELLDAYHASPKAQKWKPSHARGQERFRDFWLAAFGEGHDILQIRPRHVEKRANDAAAANAWEPRTEEAHLKYIIAAFNFAWKKLEWIGDKETLKAVDLPDVDSVGQAYTAAELYRLLDAAPKIDIRCAGVAEIAHATGRRLNVIRTLPVTAYRVMTDPDSGDEFGAILFPGDLDKSGKTRWSVLTESARRVVEMLLQLPAVKATGWLFPTGDMASAKSPKRKPYSHEQLTKKWKLVEAAAEVPYIKGRAYHGIKRRTVTEGLRAMGGDAGPISSQTATTRQTLTQTYEQEDFGDRVELARRLEERRRKAGA